MYKGHDCASVRITRGEDGNIIETRDEVQIFLDTRYISAPEAMHRIFKFVMQYKSHAVIRLVAHLPDAQNIVFAEGDEERTLFNAETRNTQLTAFFELNRVDQDARAFLYTEITKFYVYIQKEIRWKARERNSKHVSRIYNISINQGDFYYLRLLLLNVRGATSFKDLRSFNGQLYNTILFVKKLMI
jgi:hypothetical protein